jgi:hypothetical protein
MSDEGGPPATPGRVRDLVQALDTLMDPLTWPGGDAGQCADRVREARDLIVQAFDLALQAEVAESAGTSLVGGRNPFDVLDAVLEGTVPEWRETVMAEMVATFRERMWQEGANRQHGGGDATRVGREVEQEVLDRTGSEGLAGIARSAAVQGFDWEHRWFGHGQDLEAEAGAVERPRQWHPAWIEFAHRMMGRQLGDLVGRVERARILAGFGEVRKEAVARSIAREIDGVVGTFQGPVDRTSAEPQGDVRRILSGDIRGYALEVAERAIRTGVGPESVDSALTAFHGAFSASVEPTPPPPELGERQA